MKNVFVVILILSSFLSSAQSLADELKKIRNAYLAKEELSFEVSVVGYKSKTDTKGFNIGKGKAIKTKCCYYSTFLQDEYLKTEDKIIVVDHLDKEIHVFPNNDKKLQGKNSTPVVVMDSIIKISDSIRYKGISNGSKLFIIYDSKELVYKTELYSNPQSNMLEKIVYYYRESNDEDDYGTERVIIQYRNYQSVTIDKSLLLEKTFIITKGKKIIPVEKFKNYKIIQNQNVDL
jgi:hypothetical protein